MTAAGAEPKAAANWLNNEYFGRLNRAGLAIADGPVSAAANASIVKMVADGTISGKIAKDLLDIVWSEGGEPERIVRTARTEAGHRHDGDRSGGRRRHRRESGQGRRGKGEAETRRLVRRPGDESDRRKSIARRGERDPQSATRSARRRVIRTISRNRSRAGGFLRNLIRTRIDRSNPHGIRLSWRSNAAAFFGKARRYAFENATLSYCLRFGGRIDSPGPERNVRGVVSHAIGSQEESQEEGPREEEGQEGEEEEVTRFGRSGRRSDLPAAKAKAAVRMWHPPRPSQRGIFQPRPGGAVFFVPAALRRTALRSPLLRRIRLYTDQIGLRC